MIDEATIAAIKDLEKEFGVPSFEAPVGTFHVRITEDTEAKLDKVGLPYLRVAMQVLCGEEEDRKISLFARYYTTVDSDNPKAKDYPTRAKMTAGRFRGVFTDLQKSVGVLNAVNEGLRAMPSNLDHGTATQALEEMDAIASEVVGLDTHIRVTKSGDFTNIYFQGPDRLRDFNCECSLQGVRI